MTRRDLIQKWLTYALGLLPVWVLDAYVLPRYPLFGAVPMLLPAAAAAVAVLEGSYGGCGFGLGVGLLWELAYPGGYGGLVFGMALAGFLAGKAAQRVLSQSLPSCLICAAVILGALDVLRILRGLITHSAGLTTLLEVAVPEFLVSLAWTPAVYLVFWLVYDRVGGESLA